MKSSASGIITKTQLKKYTNSSDVRSSSLALLAEDDDSDDDLEAFKARVRKEADEKRAELAKKNDNTSKDLDSDIDDDDDDDDDDDIKKVIHEEFEKFTGKKFIAFEEAPVNSTDKTIKAETVTETIKAETKTKTKAKAKATRKATAKPAIKTKTKISKTTIENDDNDYNDDVTVTTVVTKRGRSCTVKNYTDNDDFDFDQDNDNDNEDYDDYDNSRKGKSKKANNKITKQNVSKPKIEAAVAVPIELKKTLQNSRSIEQLHITTGEVLHIYHQCKDAATAMGIAQCYITSCCNGKLKDYSGFRWRFYTGPEITVEELSHTLTPIADLLAMKTTKEKRKYSERDSSTNKVPKLDNNTNSPSTINTPISVTVPAVITVYKNADSPKCANIIKSPVKLINTKVNTSNQSSSNVFNTNGRSPVKVVSLNNLSNGTNNVQSSASKVNVNVVSKSSFNLNATNIPITNAIPTATPVIFDLTNDSDDDDDNSILLTTSMIDLTSAKPVVTKVTSKVKKTENTNIIRNLYSWFSTKKN